MYERRRRKDTYNQDVDAETFGHALPDQLVSDLTFLQQPLHPRALGAGVFSEPGRCHRVDLTRRTAPSAWLSRVCSFMLEVEATSHTLWNCWRDYECVWTQDILITACAMKNSPCTKSSIVAQWRVSSFDWHWIWLFPFDRKRNLRS